MSKVWPYMLGAWLVVHSLASLIGLNFSYDDEIMSVLALLAGIFVILQR